MNKEDIRQAYIAHLLEVGKTPVSVYAFCRTLGGEEVEFYKLYNSLEAIEKDVWLAWFEDTLTLLQADETYQAYSSKEKLLAFYFTWVQKLKSNRSYVLMKKEQFSIKTLKESPLSEFKKAFGEYARQLVAQGVESKDIPRVFGCSCSLYWTIGSKTAVLILSKQMRLSKKRWI
jgi:hypothetical protein